MKLKLSSFLCQILLEISVALTEFISSTLECSSSLIFSFAPSKYPLIFSVSVAYCCHAVISQSYPTLCDPMHRSLPCSSVRGYYPGKNTGVGCHAFLQGIFQTQGSNTVLPHCRWIIYCLSHQGSPYLTATLLQPKF